MVSLLTGKALEWATAVWQHLLSEHATFHHLHAAISAVSPLLSIYHGG